MLGRALARAGIAALLYWSPAMRDFRLDPVKGKLPFFRLLREPGKFLAAVDPIFRAVAR